MTEFSTGITAGSTPGGIAKGPDGNLWFTEVNGNRIGRITPSGTVTEFSTGITAGSTPGGIAAGPDGNLWFTEFNGDRIGQITTSGTVTEFSTGITANSNPSGIAAGPDGNLWFTEFGGARIGRITTSGTVTEFSTGITAGSTPTGIAAGPDGNLWFTENAGNQIGRITTSGTVTEFSSGISTNSGPEAIAAGPDGNLWFSEFGGGRIARITTSGTVTEFSAGITGGTGDGIAVGPDGNLWFTEQSGNQIGRITTSGTVTEFSAGITAASAPSGMAAGPDGNLWFTEFNGNRVAKIGAGSVPDPPTGVSGIPGDAQVTVSWSAPANDGGSPITAYTATASPGGQTCTWSTGPLNCTVTGLTNGVAYTFTVVATNALGNSAPSLPSAPVTPTIPGLYTALSPARILDTRTPIGGHQAPLGQGGSLDLTVAGVSGVPATGVRSVALNVTATDTTAASFLTVWPAGQAQPPSSNLNWAPGVTIPNLVQVKVGTNGQVSIFNNAGSTNVVVDVVGWYADGAAPTAGGYTPISPERILDTRTNIGGHQAPLGQGSSLDLTVLGVGGVPASGVSAVVLNVTVTDTTASSFLTVWPAGQAQPPSSNLNWAPGVTIPNQVIATVGAGGAVSIFNNAGSTNVVADVVGWYANGPTTGHGITSLTPARILDTRTSIGGHLGPLGQGQSLDLTVTGVGGVPASGVSAVVLNVTVTDTTAASFLTVWPSDVTRPNVSNLNWVAGVTIPNHVVVRVPVNGKVSIFNNAGSTNVVADVMGWF